MDELRNWLREQSIDLDPILDNKIHRFSSEGDKEKSGWYVGDVKIISGKRVVSLTVSDWRWGDDEKLYFRSGGLHNGELEQFKSLGAARAKEVGSEKEKANEEASKEAERIWGDAGPADSGHPYLERKQITEHVGIQGIRESGGALIIPMRDIDGKLWGIQRIWPDGTKRFLKGQRITGILFCFEGRVGGIICICEGYATGYSIHAVSGFTVYIAFNASNLSNVATAVRLLHGDARILICGDDDRFSGKNIGRERAEEAARNCQGVTVFPKFRDTAVLEYCIPTIGEISGMNLKPTDFNDLHCLEGLDEVRRQIDVCVQAEVGQNDGDSKERIHTDDAGNTRDSKADSGAGENTGSDKDKPKKEKAEKKKISQEEIERLGKEILDCRFKLHADNERTILYNISNISKKEVVICSNEELLYRRLKSNIEELRGKVPDEFFVKRVYAAWKLSTKALMDTPKSFAWSDEDEWSFKRLDFKPTEGAYPAWEEFLCRLSSREDFMAFTWSIFEMKNTSRQILYLYDPRGETGKSTVIKVLGWVFGNSFSALNNTMINGGGSRWLLGQIYGKRLIAWADCKNPKFCMSETARNISSGDPVPIEFKGGHPFQATMYAKLIIGSNHEPQITSGGADTSRLMVIGVAENKDNKDDPGWEMRLRAELPHFLNACREMYVEKCEKHGKINLSEETKNRVHEATEGFESKWEDIIERKISFGDSYEASVTDWMQLCRDERLDNNEMGNLKDYLKRRPGVKIGRKRESGPQKMRYLGFRVKSGMMGQ